MKIVKAIFRFLFSRRLWMFIGIALLCAAIWYFGDLIAVGAIKPLESDLVRLVVIGVIVILWLLSILIALIRAARRNQMFVTELTRPADKAPLKPGEAIALV